MTIKSSDAADPSLSFEKDIEAEFGQAESQYGRKMSNYRRAYDYGEMELPLDSGIPTSGSISFSDFYSKELNVIVDAYSSKFSGSSPVYQINAKTLWRNNRTNVGDSRLRKSKSAIRNCKNVIVHVNKRIGSVTEDKFKGLDQVAFKTGDWDAGTNLKIYVNPIFCTKVASKIARTYSPRHGLKEVINELVGVELDKQAQSSDWGNMNCLSNEQLAYAANDVRYLLEAKDKLEIMLRRENRWDLAKKCFKCIPVISELDQKRFSNIFDH